MSGTAIKWSEFIPHEPTVKQLAFLLCPNREVLYGGAAGGGKTDALLMAALQYADVPKYSALMLRRTYPELAKEGGLIPRSMEWLKGKGPVWNEEKKTWTFPSGAKLEFGHLQRANDVHIYQGSEYQYVGFDELTTFEQSQYRYLSSRLRRLEGSEVPLRMRAGSNPGGVGHRWVTQHFFVEGKKEGRVFIPANLEDNPYLDRETYEESLNLLDAVTYAQLRHGNWKARREGSMFKREWFEILDGLPPKITLTRVRFWDMAATEAQKGRDPDWTVGTLVALGSDGRWYIEDVVRMQGLPGDTEEVIGNVAELDGAIAICMEQEPGSSGKTVIDSYRRRVLVGKIFHGTRSTGKKIVRAMPLSSAAKAGNVKLISGPWIGDWLDELESQPGGSHDDQMDSASGAMEFLKPTKGFADFHESTDSVRADIERMQAERRPVHVGGTARGLPREDKQYAMTEVF